MRTNVFLSALLLCVVGAVSAFAQSGSDTLGLSSNVVSTLNKSSVCATVVQTGEKITFANVGGVKVGKTDSGIWMQFIAFQDKLPFKGANAIIAKGGNIERKVVDVMPCEGNASIAIASMTTEPARIARPNRRVAEELSAAQTQNVGAQRQIMPKALPQGVEEVEREVAKLFPQDEVVEDSGPKPVVAYDSKNAAGEGSVFDNLDAKVTVTRMGSMSGSDRKRDGKSITVEGTYYQPAWDGKGRIGAHATYTNGESNSKNPANGRTTNTDYWKVGAGGVSEYEFAPNTDFVVEGDLLYQDTKSRIPAKNFRSHQTEWQADLDLSIASDDNRKNGYALFPYWEVGARAIKSFGVDYSDTSNKNDWYDNSRYSVYGNVDLYDFHAGDVWRFTPTAGLEGGYMVGKSASFIEPGLSIKTAYKGKEILETGVDWRFLSGDNRWNAFGTIRPLRIGRILWAEGTADYESKR